MITNKLKWKDDLIYYAEKEKQVSAKKPAQRAIYNTQPTLYNSLFIISLLVHLC